MVGRIVVPEATCPMECRAVKVLHNMAMAKVNWQTGLSLKTWGGEIVLNCPHKPSLIPWVLNSRELSLAGDEREMRCQGRSQRFKALKGLNHHCWL